MAASWKPAYRVNPKGDAVVAVSVSRTQHFVTVREPGGQTFGRYRAYIFDQTYADTPEQAIEKRRIRCEAEVARRRGELIDAEGVLARVKDLAAEHGAAAFVRSVVKR
jgi:hypothetical protein